VRREGGRKKKGREFLLDTAVNFFYLRLSGYKNDPAWRAAPAEEEENKEKKEKRVPLLPLLRPRLPLRGVLRADKKEKKGEEKKVR